MNEDNKKVFYCNTELALDVIGGKWKPLIIYHLGYNDVIRFGEFKRLIPNINERVLMRQLRDLEEDGIINRKDYKENPPKVEYSLSDSGKSLSPIIIELGTWGKAYNEKHKYAVIDYDDKYENDNC